MESLLRNLKERVTCPICFDTYTEPKTITCLHTFCCECLKRHALTTQREGKFRCPECQAQVGVPERFDQLPTGFLQNSLLGLLAVQQSGDGSEISCGNCRKKSVETSFCFDCGKFFCPDCMNAHELLANTAFEGHKVRRTKDFQVEDYEALLKRQSFCSQQYHEREVTRFFCLECQTCVCQVCVVTGHRNHAVDPLDKAADHEKAKIMEGTELMKEKGKICGDVFREIEQTIRVLDTNISIAKREISQAVELIIAKAREREREALETLENTRTSRTERLNTVKTQLQSLGKQINQAIEFADNLVQRSSSSDILQSKKSLERRFKNLSDSPIPTLPVSSFVKFVSTFEQENVTLGFTATTEPVVEGLEQEFQAGVETALFVNPKLARERQAHISLDVDIKPTNNIASFLVSEKEEGTFQVRFTPKVPGSYSIQLAVNIGTLSLKTFTRNVLVRERQLEVVGELDLKGELLVHPRGIAVNSKGLIAVTDCDGDCIWIFDKEGNYLRKIGDNLVSITFPSGITFINDSEILVAEELNCSIQQFDVHTGKKVNSFGRRGEKVGEFQNPMGVCMDSQGRVIISDFYNNRIQVFTKEYEPLFRFGAEGDGSGSLNRPSACVFSQNTFIVTEPRNHCLKIFDGTGNFLDKIGDKGEGDGQLNWPRDLCIEKSGNHNNILVCDGENKRIVQFTVEGSYTGKTVTKLQSPTGIATTPDGKILVSDLKAKKIYILK